MSIEQPSSNLTKISVGYTSMRRAGLPPGHPRSAQIPGHHPSQVIGRGWAVGISHRAGGQTPCNSWALVSC